MQQLEIKYFFPLTEQIALDMDYRPSYEYEAKKRADMVAGSVLIAGATGVAWTTVSNNIGAPSFTIDIDQTPITIVSKTKPNFVKKFIYKTLGMKWKAK
jgi:hypothetical protein